MVPRADWITMAREAKGRSAFRRGSLPTFEALAGTGRGQWHDDAAGIHSCPVDRLCAITGKSRRAVQYDLHWGEETGWLARHRQGRRERGQVGRKSLTAEFHYTLPGQPVGCEDPECITLRPPDRAQGRPLDRAQGDVQRLRPIEALIGRKDCTPSSYAQTKPSDRAQPGHADQAANDAVDATQADATETPKTTTTHASSEAVSEHLNGKQDARQTDVPPLGHASQPAAAASRSRGLQTDTVPGFETRPQTAREAEMRAKIVEAGKERHRA